MCAWGRIQIITGTRDKENEEQDESRQETRTYSKQYVLNTDKDLLVDRQGAISLRAHL